MSINIWGVSDEDTSNTETSFVRKTGDIMKGILNMGDNRVVRIGDPVNDTDAINKKYIDNNVLHKGGNVGHLRFGTIENNNVELVRNNEPYISLGTHHINVNRKLLLTLQEPLEDSEAINKRFVDNNAVLKGGERGLATNLKLGTLDDKYVELVRNGTVYILLNNDIDLYKTINVNKKPIKDLRDPVSNSEAVPKRYVDQKLDSLNEMVNKTDDGTIVLKRENINFISLQDNGITFEKTARIHANPIEEHDVVNKRYVDGEIKKAITRCHVGYIPENPHLSGFTITATNELDNEHGILNAFDNSSSVWSTVLSNEWRIFIKCPELVKIWLFALNGNFEPALYETESTIISVNIIFNMSDDGETYFPLLDTTTTLSDVYQKFLINDPQLISYQYYCVIFRTEHITSINVRKFQMYTYSD